MTQTTPELLAPCPFCNVAMLVKGDCFTHPGTIAGDDCVLSGIGFFWKYAGRWNTRPIADAQKIIEDLSENECRWRARACEAEAKLEALSIPSNEEELLKRARGSLVWLENVIFSTGRGASIADKREAFENIRTALRTPTAIDPGVEKLLRSTLQAIESQRSEPLFIARDAIRNFLEDHGAIEAGAHLIEGDRT